MNPGLAIIIAIVGYVFMVGLCMKFFHWAVPAWRPDGHIPAGIFWPIAFPMVIGYFLPSWIINLFKSTKRKGPKISVELCPECKEKCKKGVFR